jgi:CDP-diglyceride synthetase
MAAEEKEENEKKSHHHEIHVNEINPEVKKNFRDRLLVALVLVIIVVPCIVIGDYLFLALIFVVSVFATHEIVTTPQSIERIFNGFIYFFSYLMMILLVYRVFIKNNIAFYIDSRNSTVPFTLSLYRNFDSPTISISAFALSAGFFFIMVLIDKNFTAQDAFYFIVMLFMVSLGFQSIMYLRFYPFEELTQYISYLASDGEDVEYYKNLLNSDAFRYFQSFGLLFFMLIGVVFNDIGAYIFGVIFGSHKMSPRISPHKTREGFFGGLVTSIVFSFTRAILLDYFGYPLLLVLDMKHRYNCLVISIILPLTGTFGDLIFSSIKRNYKIKDFGKILRSHGGILDRTDSIIISSIAMGLLIPIMENARKIYR